MTRGEPQRRTAPSSSSHQPPWSSYLYEGDTSERRTGQMGYDVMTIPELKTAEPFSNLNKSLKMYKYIYNLAFEDFFFVQTHLKNN